VFEVEVDEIGPSLRYATAKVNKASRGSSSGGFGSGSRPSGEKPADDPWGSAPAAGSSGGSDDEPPF
jgi:single-strand DNA-binding protein